MLGTLTTRRAVVGSCSFDDSSSRMTAPSSPSAVLVSTTTSGSRSMSRKASSFHHAKIENKHSITSHGPAAKKKNKTPAVVCSNCAVCASMPFNVRVLTSEYGDDDDAAAGVAPADSAESNNDSHFPPPKEAATTTNTTDVVNQQQASLCLSPTSPTLAASKKLQRFQDDIERRCGCNLDDCLQDVALLNVKELKTGKRLGKGGSASVYDVTGLVLIPQLPMLPLPTEREEQEQEEDDDKERQDPDDATTSNNKKMTNEQLRQALKDSISSKQEKYVLKRLSKGIQGQLLEGDKYARACAINMVLEAQILRVLDHPNILTLHGMSQDDANLFLVLSQLPTSMEQRIDDWRRQVRKCKKREQQLLLTAAKSARSSSSPVKFTQKLLCGNGTKSAAKALREQGQQLEVNVELRKALHERIRVALDVAGAVAHLHGRGIIYRDLKTSNIGFDSDGVVKLLDFGIARFLPAPLIPQEDGDDSQNGGDLEDSFLMSKVGTRCFQAPEIVAKEAYNTKADVYSFGVLLWQLLALNTPTPVGTASPPPPSAAAAAPFNMIVSPHDQPGHPRFEFPMCPCWPMYVQSLLRRILQRNPKLRPTMAEIERKLSTTLEKLDKEIATLEERLLHDYRSSHNNPAAASSTDDDAKNHPKSTTKIKRILPLLFGNDVFGRQKTFEIDYSKESGDW